MNPPAALTHGALISRVKNAVAAGTSDQDGTVLDMSGYDAVLWIVLFNTVVDTSVLALESYGSAASDGSSPTKEANTANVTASSASNKFLVLDVVLPRNRYQFCRVKRGTANATIDAVIGIRYRTKVGPVAADAAALASTLAVLG